MIPVITECCYTCINSLVVKQICKLKNRPIKNLYKDVCNNYVLRRMYKCNLCNNFVVSLQQHIYNYHHKTMTEYIILTRNLEELNSNVLRRNCVWQQKKI